MNKRIKEIEQQCWSHRVEGTLVDGQLHFDTQKFAELIVRECIEQASIGNERGNNQWDRALTFAAKNIKEHFGVK